MIGGTSCYNYEMRDNESNIYIEIVHFPAEHLFD